MILRKDPNLEKKIAMITSLCQLRSNKVMMLKNAFGDPPPLRKLFISDQSSVKKSRIKFTKSRNFKFSDSNQSNKDLTE